MAEQLSDMDIPSAADLPAGVFRTYDIRGQVETQLTPPVVYAVGRALAAEMAQHGRQKTVLGRDGRLSSPSLHAALTAGLLAGGITIHDIGLVPTPVLYFATHHLNIDCGIMLTGSHNPGDYNGIKMVVAGETLSCDRVQALLHCIQAKNWPAPVSDTKVIDAPGLIDAYVADVVARLPLARPLKLVIDCGNGAGGVVAPKLFRAMGCEVISLYDEVDGHFPNHHPDPAEPENLAVLIQAVKDNKADCGLAFDGDADRLGLVTDQGEIIWPDRQMMCFAQSVLEKTPGGEIVFDVKCSRFLAEVVEKAGGVPLMWKTGHSLLKAKLRERQAALAGEMSGHIFFVDNWYGFDDGMYAGARFCDILSRYEGTASQLFQALPNSVVTPELKIPMPDDQKAAFMEKLVAAADFPDGEVNTLDGLRVDYADGFALVRPSNTTPYLVARFEAATDAGLQAMQKRWADLLKQIDPAIVLPF